MLNYNNASSTSRDRYLKTLHATKCQSYAELTFDVHRSSKPINDLSSLLARIAGNRQQFDPQLRVATCKVAVNQVEDQVALEIGVVMK